MYPALLEEATGDEKELCSGHGLRHSSHPSPPGQDPPQQAAVAHNLPRTLAAARPPGPCLLPSLPLQQPHHSILQLQIPALPPYTIIWDRLAKTPRLHSLGNKLSPLQAEVLHYSKLAKIFPPAWLSMGCEQPRRSRRVCRQQNKPLAQP